MRWSRSIGFRRRRRWLPEAMAKRKKQVFSAGKEVRAIARERVGRVKAGVVIVPKADRKPKYKLDPLKDADGQ